MTAETRDMSRPSGPTVLVAGRRWKLPHPDRVAPGVLAEFWAMRARTRRYDHLPDRDSAPTDIASDGVQPTTVGLLRKLVGGVADRMALSGATEGELAGVARDYLQLVESGTGPLAQPRPNRRERRQRVRGGGRS